MTAWYDKATFYHMYPLGMTGSPFANPYPVSDGAADGTNRDVSADSRMDELMLWIPYLESLHISAIYIGPLFESSTHGYDTRDFRLIDRRLGTNVSFRSFVDCCHEHGIRVVVDGVFNHTGREFFAFRNLQAHRDQSPYAGWYRNVNFGWGSPLGDSFGYESWHGIWELPCLNHGNPEVRNYLLDTVRFWVQEFDVDGIRLDCAGDLSFEFMQELRRLANEIKPEFWLMGEVIHGDYSRWVNGQTLHSVTNYALHKALYSGHNDHNYFEIAHTVKYLQNMGDLDLYNFVDNHDVERIHTKLQNKAHFAPVHVLLYTLPGVPSIYYGSEFGIDGKKEKFSDASLRPALDLNDYADAATKNPCTALIAALGKVRQGTPALSYGSYAELALTNRQFAFARDLEGIRVIVTVNNDDSDSEMNLPTGSAPEYVGALTGQKVSAQGGRIRVRVAANSGEIWLPAGDMPEYKPVQTNVPETAAAKENESNAPETEENQAAEAGSVAEAPSTPEAEASTLQETAAEVPNPDKTPEEMTVGELQAAILAKMAGNGPVTDQMKKTVYDNIWHDSLVNWLKSFR